MSETPPELDLKFLPDWLKEEPSTSRYADYEGESEDRGYRGGGGGRDRDRGPRREGRGPGGPGRPGGKPGGGPRGPGGPGGGPRGERRGPGGGGPRGERRGGPGGGGPRGERRFEDRGPRPERPPQAPPPKVKIEFLPEPAAAEGIAKQIKQSGRAYPLFGTGRMFLEKPERHRVRISTLDPTVVLYQIGDGPIALEPESLERSAFHANRSEYYEDVTVQGEEIKGNFRNVARSRSTGQLLGPTSYHSYQPSLRRLWEERFSRRMRFEDFLHQDIEIRTDEQTINDWKEQARSTTTFKTKKEETPVEFKTLAEVETHFRNNYLRQLVKAGLSLECSGPASRALPDRALSHMLRDAWEREKGFPGQLVNHLRPYLVEAGLHFFKHRKRILYVGASKPTRHKVGEPMSPGVEAILKVVEENPKCNRRTVATKLLGENPDAPELAEQKAALARDLLYLLHAGHVIEFHDGTLDLPLVPQPPQPPRQPKPGGKQKLGAAAGGEAETSGEVSGLEEAILSSADIEAESLPGAESLSAEGAPAESASVSLVSHEGAAAELDQPVVLTPGMDAPAPAFSHDEPLPEPTGEATLGESTGTFASAAGEHATEAAVSYTGASEAILPGATSFAEETPAELIEPPQVVDLRESAPAEPTPAPVASEPVQTEEISEDAPAPVASAPVSEGLASPASLEAAPSSSSTPDQSA